MCLNPSCELAHLLIILKRSGFSACPRAELLKPTSEVDNSVKLWHLWPDHHLIPSLVIFSPSLPRSFTYSHSIYCFLPELSFPLSHTGLCSIPQALLSCLLTLAHSHSGTSIHSCRHLFQYPSQDQCGLGPG